MQRLTPVVATFWAGAVRTSSVPNAYILRRNPLICFCTCVIAEKRTAIHHWIPKRNQRTQLDLRPSWRRPANHLLPPSFQCLRLCNPPCPYFHWLRLLCRTVFWAMVLLLNLGPRLHRPTVNPSTTTDLLTGQLSGLIDRSQEWHSHDQHSKDRLSPDCSADDYYSDSVEHSSVPVSSKRKQRTPPALYSHSTGPTQDSQ